MSAASPSGLLGFFIGVVIVSPLAFASAPDDAPALIPLPSHTSGAGTTDSMATNAPVGTDNAPTRPGEIVHAPIPNAIWHGLALLGFVVIYKAHRQRSASR